MRFVHIELAQTVRNAPQAAAEELGMALSAAGVRRALLIASPRELPRARQLLSADLLADAFTDVRVHVPVPQAQAATTAARDCAADALVAVGGGSAVGLAKAIALELSLPIFAVPTTYSGSEATDMWGMTEGSVKTTGVDPRVLPHTVVYDASLTLDLPTELTTYSGINGIAHCIDALWAPRTNPFIQATAEEGLRQLAAALRALHVEPRDFGARELALGGVYLAGRSFAQSGSGMHHKLCHVLGGRFNLPHAPLHAAILPHVTALNAPHAPEASQRIARALGSADAVAGLFTLYGELDIAPTLRDLGVEEAELDAAAEACLPVVPESNPAPVTLQIVRAVLQAAYDVR